MRTSLGIGLSVVFGLLACGTEHVTRYVDGPGDGTDGTQTTDPNDPSNPTNPDKPPSPLVEGLTLSEIAVYQGVKIDVMKSGAAVKSLNAPIVVGRQALVRAFVTPASGWKPREVVAELRIIAGTTKLPIIQASATITKASTDGDTKSTFNFDVPADSIPMGATFQVSLTDPEGTPPDQPSDARYPKDGTFAKLSPESSGVLKVVIVPVKYNTDSSGRTPDTSAAQIELYKSMMMARYPATDVEISVHSAYNWTRAISGSGDGFEDILSAITQLRRSDAVGPNVYYYGALAPKSSMSTFCGGGCVTGLSAVADTTTPFLRASVGIGFTGDESGETMAHEVGHAHGREHAPCGGAAGADPDFPYDNGGIGVWGYDILERKLKSPSNGHDMMGYCSNTWVSDYTYSALFDRIQYVTQAAGGGSSKGSGSSFAASTPETFRVATVDASGAMTWSDEIDLDRAPEGGMAKTTTYLSEGGASIATGTARFYPYDHLPGGVLVMRSSPTVSSPNMTNRTWSHVRVDGMKAPLAR